MARTPSQKTSEAGAMRRILSGNQPRTDIERDMKRVSGPNKTSEG